MRTGEEVRTEVTPGRVRDQRPVTEQISRFQEPAQGPASQRRPPGHVAAKSGGGISGQVREGSEGCPHLLAGP